MADWIPTITAAPLPTAEELFKPLSDDEDPDADPNTAPRELIPGYKNMRFIGRGSHGIVFSAVDATTGQPVAIKLSM